MYRSFLFGVFVVCLIQSGPVLAGEVPLRLQELIDTALSRNPEVRSARARWEAEKAKISQAWNLKKPWVSYEFMGNEIQTRSGPMEERFGVTQELPFPTKLPLRSKVAHLEAMQAEHEVLHAEQHIRNQVVSAYAQLGYAQKAREVLEEERTLLEQIAASIRSQVATGARPAADAARVEAELARLAERLLMLEDRRVTAEEKLNVLLGQPRSTPWPSVEIPAVPTLSLSREELTRFALEYRHRLVIAKLTDKAQKVRHQLAQMEYLPDLEVGFMYTEIGGGTTTRADDGEDAWMIPVKISLPFWEPQIRGGVREARAQKEAAEEDVEQAVNMTQAEVADRHTRYLTARDRIGVSEATWIPQANQALQSARSSYEAGGGDVLDVLDSERMVLEAKLGYWQSLADTVSAYAALEQAVGVPFSSLTKNAGETPDMALMEGGRMSK